jgi:diguanylate cyclase (GGDEF)-like protein/PAS domain S-box-containing protein
MASESPDQLRAVIDRQRSQIQHMQADSVVLQDRYALMLAGSADGIWDWDIAGNSIYFSPRWKAILGFQPEEHLLSPDEWLNRIHPDDLPSFKKQLDAHLNGLADEFRCEHRIMHKSESFRWVSSRGAAFRLGGGPAVRIAGSMTDITDRKLAEEQLQHDALHDPLTGLANRTLLLDRIGFCLERARRVPDERFAVLILDLDRFKVLNDSLGHDAGDQLLVEIARRINLAIRAMDMVARLENDYLARLGGDEFVLLLTGIRHDADAIRVAERLQEALAEPIQIEQHEVITSVTMGIAFGDAACATANDLLRDADTALVYAKTESKTRYRFFDPQMHDRALQRLSLESELRQAIETQQFEVFYQPIHSLLTRRIVEFEALVRWRHPTRGLVSPADFIPLAEETGLVIPLGAWVMHEACRQLRQWQDQYPEMQNVSIGVNVSGKQFARPELLTEVKSTLEETGLKASHLCLEITESTIMESGAPATDVLEAFHNLGTRLHMDDFGTGYSSFRYLNQMPIDVLKIDQSFIREISERKTGRSVVHAIVALAQTLDMRVIAEGVETPLQVALLAEMGCDCAQGYYFSRPMQAGSVLEYAKNFASMTAAAKVALPA